MGFLLWIVLAILAVVLVLAVVVLVRTFAFKPPAAPNAAPAPVPDAPDEVLARLTRAISIPTVCAQNYEDTNFAPFDEFIAFLQEAYPLFHQTCGLTRVNTYALVYKWAGSDASLPPMMLTAHYDVVPVEEGTAAEWKYPGFSGQVAEGRIWGRGTLDIKSQLTAHMEAAEALMREGFVPKRDVYFVYGQDEEISGQYGAQKVSEYFEENDIRLDGILDEGGFAVSNVIKGVEAPLALIGVAEKGFVNYQFTMPGEGGHSSMPPAHTALGKLAGLITRIEDNPLPARLTPPVEEMLRNIAGEMGFVVRMAVANLWLFRPLLLGVLSKAPATNALVRTTFAATMAGASTAANVLPQKALATVNVRLLPGDTKEGVAAYFTQLAENDGYDGLEVELPPGSRDPSQVSPTSSPAWQKLTRQIHALYPNVIATPYLVMGGTDARKYYNVCDNIYRFTPMLVTNEEKDTVHSANESVTVENYSRMILFYEQYIKEYDD